MLVPFVLFWLLLGWGLHNGYLVLKEGGILVAIWVVFLVGFILLKISSYWFVSPTVLLDIYLVLKVFGGDIKIR